MSIMISMVMVVSPITARGRRKKDDFLCFYKECKSFFQSIRKIISKFKYKLQSYYQEKYYSTMEEYLKIREIFENRFLGNLKKLLNYPIERLKSFFIKENVSRKLYESESHKSINQSRIKLGSCTSMQFLFGVFFRNRFPVWPSYDHYIISIDN